MSVVLWRTSCISLLFETIVTCALVLGLCSKIISHRLDSECHIKQLNFFFFFLHTGENTTVYKFYTPVGYSLFYIFCN